MPKVVSSAAAGEPDGFRECADIAGAGGVDAHHDFSAWRDGDRIGEVLLVEQKLRDAVLAERSVGRAVGIQSESGGVEGAVGRIGIAGDHRFAVALNRQLARLRRAEARHAALAIARISRAVGVEAVNIDGKVEVHVGAVADDKNLVAAHHRHAGELKVVVSERADAGAVKAGVEFAGGGEADDRVVSVAFGVGGVSDSDDLAIRLDRQRVDRLVIAGDVLLEHSGRIESLVERAIGVKASQREIGIRQSASDDAAVAFQLKIVHRRVAGERRGGDSAAAEAGVFGTGGFEMFELERLARRSTDNQAAVLEQQEFSDRVAGAEVDRRLSTLAVAGVERAVAVESLHDECAVGL